ncbi:MAG: hypothetical protein SGI96_05490 [Bacteroidota bacterium]|nr:hypothetical protein [Bacteroidota bacterium]
MAHSVSGDNSLTNLQLEFLKSLKYMATEKQLQDIKSLVRHYFDRQLDNAIEKAETEKDYTAGIYESWLKGNPGDAKSSDV